MINAILEWKVQITDEDRGTLYSYLQHLCRGDYNNTYRGIVADRTGFICAECENESIRNIMAVKWTDRGAEDYIQNFISKKNQWLSLFDDLCNVNQVLPAVYKNSSSAFLGSGKERFKPFFCFEMCLVNTLGSERCGTCFSFS
jgi:hypothetical protein